MGRPIRLHVDELVLHGLPQIDATRVADALQRELRWRLAELELPSGLSTPARAEHLVAPGPVVVEGGARPESVGRQVGQALWRSLGGVAR